MIKSKDILALLIIPTLSCQAAHADTSYWPNSFNAALNDIDNYFSEIPEETQHWQAIKTDAYKNINIDNNVHTINAGYILMTLFIAYWKILSFLTYELLIK